THAHKHTKHTHTHATTQAHTRTLITHNLSQNATLLARQLCLLRFWSTKTHKRHQHHIRHTHISDTRMHTLSLSYTHIYTCLLKAWTAHIYKQHHPHSTHTHTHTDVCAHPGSPLSP